MKYILSCLFTGILLLPGLWTGRATAQTLQGGAGAPATPLNVCGGSKTFLIRINGAGAACGSATLTINMPSGYNYVPGTATINAGTGSVTETAVSATGGTLTISSIPTSPGFTEVAYQAYADCSLIGVATSSEVQYTLAGCTGTVNASSNPFNVQYADLNIPSMTNSGFTGTVGNTYTRVITVQNGGFGSLTDFKVEDKSGNGFAIISAVASSGVLTLSKSLVGADTLYTYSVAGATPDGIFSNGESITITETVRIIGCANLTSQIEAWYGCSAAKCSANTVNGLFTAGATINSSLQPNLVWIHSQNYATCRGNAYTNTLRLVNNGTSLMVAPHVDLYTGATDGSNNVFNASISATDLFMSAFNPATVTYKIGVAGTPAPITPDSTRNYNTPATCLSGYVGQISLTFPDLAAGDTIYLSYQQKECCPTTCPAGTEVFFAGIKGNWQYKNGCGVSSKSTTTQLFRNYASTSINAISSLPSDMAAGIPYTFRYDISNLSLQGAIYPAGSLVSFTLQLPAQTKWTGNPADIDAIYRNSVTPLNFNSISYNSTTNVITMNYISTTTEGLDSLYNAFFYFNKITLDCSKPAGSNVAVFNATVTQPGCGCAIKYECESSTVTPHCPAACTDGILPLNVTATRVNFDKPDNDNNRQPDVAGTLDMNKIRTNWVMHGDTLRFRYQGKVVNTTPSLVFTNGYVSFTNGTAFPNSRMSGINASARIFNSAGVQIGYCSNIPFSYNAGTGRGTADYSIAALQSCGFPGSYTKFQDGDSVVVDMNCRMTGLLDGQYITPVTAATEFYVSPMANPTAPNQYKCDVFSTSYNVVGTYQASNGAKIVPVAGCDQVVVINDYFISVGTCCNYSSLNAFTNEFRPVNNFDSLIVTIPAGYTLANATVEFNVGTAHGVGSLTPAVAITPVNPGGNPLIYKLSNQYVANGGTVLQPDEANYIYTKFYLQPTCTTPATTTMPMRFTQIAAPGYADPAMTYSLNMTNTLNATMPTATLTALNPNITVTSGTAVWELQIANSTAQTAPTTWLAKNAAISGVTITSLEQISGPGGSVVTTLTPTGSIYQLGALNGFTSKYYRVKGTFLSCVKDSINIAFGFQCTGYPTSVATAACVQTANLTVIPQSAALQLTILSQPSGTQNLCALLPYEMEVLNTSLADATSLTIQAQLPASGGVIYEPGSYQISIPAGSPYVTISDANVSISGGAYTFAVPAATLSELNGGEKFQIRFNLRSQACAFKSGGRLNFTPYGQNPCNQIVSGSVQNSQPIRLTGAPVSNNGFTMTSRMGDTLYACSSAPANTLPYSFKIVNNGPTASSTVHGFTIEVPAGFTFSGTEAISYAPAGVTMNVTNVLTAGGSRLYTFRTSAGNVPVGDSIKVTATVSATNILTTSCGAKAAMKEAAIVSFTATCVQDASTCTSDETLAEHESNTFYVKRPAYAISSFSAMDAPNGPAITGTVVVQNTNGYVTGEQMTIHLVKDVNLNGIIDFPADKDFGTETFTTNATGATTSYTYRIAQATTGQACPIIAEVTGACNGGSGTNCGYAQTYYMCSFTLPVKLTSFTGKLKECTAILEWTTASEQDNNYYAVEESIDGKNYAEVTRVESRNLANGSRYSVSAGNISGQAFFRLRMVDVDGTAAYSQTVQLKSSDCASGVNVFPNPAADELNVAVTGSEGTISYMLVDMAGRTLQSGSLQNHKVDIRNIANGIYTFRIIVDGTTYTQNIKVLK